MNPLAIHTPAVYVKRLLLGRNYEKRIEQRTVQARG
jgi:3-oxoacid CoA-transferase subunit A